jgi:hypothetical protein
MELKELKKPCSWPLFTDTHCLSGSHNMQDKVPKFTAGCASSIILARVLEAVHLSGLFFR